MEEGEETCFRVRETKCRPQRHVARFVSACASSFLPFFPPVRPVFSFAHSGPQFRSARYFACLERLSLSFCWIGQFLEQFF